MRQAMGVLGVRLDAHLCALLLHKCIDAQTIAGNTAGNVVGGNTAGVVGGTDVQRAEPLLIKLDHFFAALATLFSHIGTPLASLLSICFCASILSLNARHFISYNSYISPPSLPLRRTFMGFDLVYFQIYFYRGVFGP